MQTSTMTYQAASAHHTELRRAAAVRRSTTEARSDSGLLIRLVALVRPSREPAQAAAPAKRSSVVVGRFAV